jgi:hypothetical protein
MSSTIHSINSLTVGLVASTGKRWQMSETICVRLSLTIVVIFHYQKAL